jgi:molybdate transport system regulatory protein
LTLRIVVKPGTAIGPGKADLLQGIEETGSIAAAGRRMGMSYKRAWYLINTLNDTFRDALVVSTKGGKSGGGAELTETGRAVLMAYRRAERAAWEAAAESVQDIQALAIPPKPTDTGF